MIVYCAACCEPTEKPTGEVNRAASIGARLYCDRACAGLMRRGEPKPKAQKVAEKRVYDMAYRAKNRAMLKAKKRAYFERTYDPVKAAGERKKRMHLHVVYCRQPRYRAWKREYDKKLRASEYGPFSEAYLLAMNLNREIKTRMPRHEIYAQNQTLNKRQSRSRAAAETPSRDRHSGPQG